MMFSDEQIKAIYILTNQYIALRDRRDETGIAAWRERVRKIFPYETNVMLIKIWDVVEQKERETNASSKDHRCIEKFAS